MKWTKIKYNIPDRPKILFIGINPHPGSYRRGVPFSNNKNFWYNLSRAGLIEIGIDEIRDDDKLRRFYDNEFCKVYGFINIIDRPTVDTTKLKKGEEKDGVNRINEIIKRKRPIIVCFVGKVTFSRFSGQKRFQFGLSSMRIDDSLVYIASFPIRGPNSLRLKELEEIKSILERIRKGEDGPSSTTFI